MGVTEHFLLLVPGPLPGCIFMRHIILALNKKRLKGGGGTLKRRSGRGEGVRKREGRKRGRLKVHKHEIILNLFLT